MSVPVLYNIMLIPIEFFEIPDAYEIELEFSKKRGQTMKCRCEISYNNVVTEIYDSSGNIFAATLGDLRQLGVVKATVKALHSVDLSEVI